MKKLLFQFILLGIIFFVGYSNKETLSSSINTEDLLKEEIAESSVNLEDEIMDGSVVVESTDMSRTTFFRYNDSKTFLKIEEKIYLYNAITGQLMQESEKSFEELAGCDYFEVTSVKVNSNYIMVCGRKTNRNDTINEEEKLIEMILLMKKKNIYLIYLYLINN